MDVVTFLPAGDPWQKTDERSVTAADVRCAMVAAAIADVPHFEMDRREVDRAGPSYTWDTVMSFGDEVVLVVGADSAAGVRTWHRGDELVERVPLAVARRPGTKDDQVEAVIPHVRWLEMPAIDISSTELRSWLRRRFSGRFLIPDSVRDVIRTESLYRQGDIASGR